MPTDASRPHLVPARTPATMRAAVQRRYGGPEVLSTEDVAVPAPGPRDVLVRVAAASVNAGDWHLMRGTPWPIRLMFGGLFRPKVATLGSDVAGTVVAVGAEVDAFAPGDEVVGELSEDGFGAFAEFACAPARRFASKPSGATWVEAAAFPAAGRVALQAVRDVREVGHRTRVLVHGASGGVGTFAVQIAKARGAHVTAVGGRGSVALLESLGADVAHDRTLTPIEQLDERFDLVVDLALFRSIRVARRLLADGGAYVVIGGGARHFFETLALAGLLSRGTERIVAFEAAWHDGDLAELGALIAAGEVCPVVDRTYALDDVADAVRHVESGHPRGKIVVTT